MNRLQVSLLGMNLRNPLLLASGIMGETGGSLRTMAESGAGGLVTKSIGSVPRKGHSNPSLVVLQDGYINAMGLPNPGIEAFREEMVEAQDITVPIIGSVFGSSADEFAILAGKMAEYGASAIELNLSCPHAKGYGMETGVDPDIVRGIVQAVKTTVSVPVLAKLTPNTHRLKDVALAVQDGGGDAVVAINTVKAMAISVEARRPILSNRYGGMSGPAVKAVGLRCVYELYECLDIPIVGVGGVEDWRGALEYMMAGAKAVQIGSGVGRKGLKVFDVVAEGMDAYLEENGFGNIAEIVGVAHE